MHTKLISNIPSRPLSDDQKALAYVCRFLTNESTAIQVGYFSKDMLHASLAVDQDIKHIESAIEYLLEKGLVHTQDEHTSDIYFLTVIGKVLIPQLSRIPVR